jgi:hypothetical protein
VIDAREGIERRAVRFPENPREGDDAHTDALERLDAARNDVSTLTATLETSRGTPEEDRAADALGTATERFAAREAWVKWIERGY